MDFIENISTGQQEAMYLAMAAIDKTPTKHFSARFKSPGSTMSDATTLFNASSKLQGRRTQEKTSHVTFQAATDTPSPFQLQQPHLAASGSDSDDSENDSPRRIQASISASPPAQHAPRQSKAIRDAIISTIPVFNLERAIKDPDLAKFFYWKIQHAANRLHLNPIEIDDLLTSKLDPECTVTQAWYFELYETNDLPNSLAAWKTLIWDHCSIPAIEREYAITLFSFKQGVNTAYLTFHTRYTTLMRQAGVKDSTPQANHFIQALNQQDFGLLTADPFFRLEEETGITIKRTHETMMKLLSYRKRNEAKAS